MSNADLIKRASGGDRQALGVLSDRYRKAVFSVVSRVVGDRAAAEKLVTEVFRRVVQQPGGFPTGRGAFLTRLVAVARDVAIEERRKRQPPGPN